MEDFEESGSLGCKKKEKTVYRGFGGRWKWMETGENISVQGSELLKSKVAKLQVCQTRCEKNQACEKR